MSTNTTNYGFPKPTVNADADTWGGELNDAADMIDSTIKAVSDASAKVANNLSDLANAATARSNLGLGTAATHSAGSPSYGRLVSQGANVGGSIDNNIMVWKNEPSDGTIVAMDSGVDVSSVALASDAALRANNLSDLTNAGTARSNLGLGAAATKAVSYSTAGTLLSTDTAVTDGRVVIFNVSGSNVNAADSGIASGNLVLRSNNLSDLTSAASARTNLGLGSAATANTSAFDAAGSAAAAQSAAQNSSLQKSANLSDVSNASTALANLGIKRFIVSGITMANGGHNAYNHGLGSTPTLIQAYFVNAIAEAGYSPGDEVIAPAASDPSINRGVTVWANASQIGYGVAGAQIAVQPKGGGAPVQLTYANWTLRLVAQT